MQRLTIVVLGILGAILLIGLIGPVSGKARKPMKVALITPGAISDGGWNQAAYQGLKKIERELKAQTAHAEVRAPADYPQAFRDFASRGFDLIFGHGFEFGDAALEISRLFPKSFFVITSGRVQGANVASLQMQINEPAYLLGYLAGKMSRTKKVGCVGGMKIPSVERSLAGFVAGALETKGKIQVRVTYTGSFEDVLAAKEAARALIRWGADFLMHNADASGIGVFQAASEGKGVFAFGCIQPQHSLMPKVVLGSAVADIPSGFLTIAFWHRDGRLRGKIYYLGLKEGAVRVVFNPRLVSQVPRSLLAELDAVKQKITSGLFKVPDRMPADLASGQRADADIAKANLYSF
ncbi:MAG: BMP family protein [Armatimonadetes bacterium]|nr:BMP family protein [Armatimonadota bacterium]MDW8122617.1 BMP family protein [Armatimonadota bacterium]